MIHLQKTDAGCVESKKYMHTSLRGIKIKAKRDVNHKFGNLYCLLKKDLNNFSIGNNLALVLM